MENQTIRLTILGEKYLKNMLKNSLLELEKDFIELEDRELKDREGKIKIKVKELFCKPIIVSKDDKDKFEEQEMKKIRLIKRNWFD